MPNLTFISSLYQMISLADDQLSGNVVTCLMRRRKLS
jgi:hypothetical protein